MLLPSPTSRGQCFDNKLPKFCLFCDIKPILMKLYLSTELELKKAQAYIGTGHCIYSLHGVLPFLFITCDSNSLYNSDNYQVLADTRLCRNGTLCAVEIWFTLKGYCTAYIFLSILTQLPIPVAVFISLVGYSDLI